MTLRTYLRVLAERWKLIVVFVIAATGVSVLVTATTSKVYEANVQIFVASTDTSASGGSYQGAAFAQTLVQSFADIVASPAVIDGVRKDLHYSTGYLSDQALRSKVSATAAASKSILELHVRDSSADRAAKIANSAARSFSTVAEGYYAGNSQGEPLRLIVTSVATPPDSPVEPKPILNILLGFLLGLLVGTAVAVVRDVLDNRVKDVESLSKLAGKPAMGAIVDDPLAARHVIAARAGSRNVRAENFRQLRANLQFANVDHHPRVIAITSSIPSEGKSMVAANLASALAETGFSVCLLDADLRRPTIAKAFGVPGAVGLTNVLIHQVSLEDALQPVGSTLHVLSSGPIPPNPSEVLASSYVRDVIRSLLDRFDFVILDTAPLLPVSDGAEVAALADGTLLVARHKLTTEAHVRRSVASLSRVDARVLGVVLNRVPNSRAGEYGYSYYRSEAVSPPAGTDPPSAEASGRGRRRKHAAPTGASDLTAAPHKEDAKSS